MSNKQLSISDFCAHAADEIAAVEESHTLVELVRDGQVVAYLCPAPEPKSKTGTLADWAGTGAGYSLAPGCSLDDPVFSPEDWEEFPDSAE